MANYKDIVEKAFGTIGKTLEWVDPFEFLKIHTTVAACKWLPSYAARCEDRTYLFKPYDGQLCEDAAFVSREVEHANSLLCAVSSVHPSARFFLIVHDFDDLSEFSTHPDADEFGAILARPDNPTLCFKIDELKNRDHRLVGAVLGSLRNIQHISEPFRSKIVSFAMEHYGCEDPDVEEAAIKPFVEDLLGADSRLGLSFDPVVFMGKYELMLQQAGCQLRDHYYHAVNTLLLGYLVIDKAYDRFQSIAANLGTQMSPEIVWLLTALFHDVGYPLAKEFETSQAMYGLTMETDRDTLKSLCQQKRLGFWNCQECQDTLKPISYLFEHLLSGSEDVWHYDGFLKAKLPGEFTEALKSAFVNDAAHGAAGALHLGLSLRPNLLETSGATDREFVYQHCYLAAINILLHDQRVRTCLRDRNIGSLPAERFGFALLLTYIDVLQNDKRETLTDVDLPLIYNGIEASDGSISIKLRGEAMSGAVKCAVTKELGEALAFFIMNGITLTLPDTLVA